MCRDRWLDSISLEVKSEQTDFEIEQAWKRVDVSSLPDVMQWDVILCWSRMANEMHAVPRSCRTAAAVLWDALRLLRTIISSNLVIVEVFMVATKRYVNKLTFQKLVHMVSFMQAISCCCLEPRLNASRILQATDSENDKQRVNDGATKRLSHYAAFQLYGKLLHLHLQQWPCCHANKD